MPAIIQRLDSNAYRILVETEVVAMAFRLSDDRWALFDMDDHRMSNRSFSTPQEAATHFDELDNRDRLVPSQEQLMSDTENDKDGRIAELRMALRSALEWIDAVPPEVASSLPAMPGFDRDWAESLINDQTSQAQKEETMSLATIITDHLRRRPFMGAKSEHYLRLIGECAAEAVAEHNQPAKEQILELIRAGIALKAELAMIELPEGEQIDSLPRFLHALNALPETAQETERMKAELRDALGVARFNDEQ